MDARTKRTVLITTILVVAFAVRLSAGMWWQQRLPDNKRFHFGDSESYWALGRALARGEPFEYGPGPGKVFRTPGYPLLLAPLFMVRDEPPVSWARAEAALLGTFAVAATMGLGRTLFDESAGYVAGAVSAIYPEAIGASVFVLSEAPYSPLLVAQVWCWGAAVTVPCRKRGAVLSAVTGLVAGLATLMRPSHLLFVPFALGLAMLCRERSRHLKSGALILIAMAATLTPWWVRNFQVTGRFVATTLQFGASLYDGWNPATNGSSDMRFVDQFVADQRREDRDATVPPVGTFEQRLDDRMKRAAIAWAKSEPASVASLAVTKFRRMWGPLPNAAEFQSPLFRFAVFGSFLPVLLLAAIGAWTSIGRGWPVVICLLPAVYLTCLHLVFVSSIRYREPAMLPLIVLAAGAVCRWIHFPTRSVSKGEPRPSPH